MTAFLPCFDNSSSVWKLTRNFDDGRLSAEEHPRRHSQPLALAVYLCNGWMKITYLAHVWHCGWTVCTLIFQTSGVDVFLVSSWCVNISFCGDLIINESEVTMQTNWPKWVRKWFTNSKLHINESEITMQTNWPKWVRKWFTNSKLVVEVSLSFARWRHCFPKLIQTNSGTMFRIKWLWFVPNLVKISSIFLKL